MRSQASTPPSRLASLRNTRFSAACNWPNTIDAPISNAPAPSIAASEPVPGRCSALATIMRAVSATCGPANSPIWWKNSPCAVGYIDVVSHSSITTSGASDSRV